MIRSYTKILDAGTLSVLTCVHLMNVLLLFNRNLFLERKTWKNGLPGASCKRVHRVISVTDGFFANRFSDTIFVFLPCIINMVSTYNRRGSGSYSGVLCPTKERPF